MSVTISPPVRVIALAGLLAATALALFLFLAGRSGGEGEPAAAVTPVARPAVSSPRANAVGPAAKTPGRAQAFTLETKSGFPLVVDRALRRNGVAVVVVYMPGSGVDFVVRKEARAGALVSGAAYVPVSAVNERLVRSLVARTGVLPDPAVVIVKRPGVVAAILGVTDRDTVAQAVTQAKR